jgi:mono/diheme cytochrome c family protein
VLATAGGLVFQGAQRGELAAYRDTDGQKLWSTDPQTGVVAAPVSYEVNGEQYIAQLAGYGTRDYYAGNNSRLLVYKLGGKARLPPLAALPPARPLDPPAAFGTPAQLALGERVYNDNCTMCHDTQYGNRGLFPDLRYTPLLKSASGFQAVVLGGALASRGMASFRERFGAEEAEAVRAFITQRARAALPQTPAR